MESTQRKINKVPVRLRLSDGSMISGEVNLWADERADRLSELFTKGTNPFIVVFNAMQQGKAGQTFVVNKNHIVWAGLDEV